MIRAHHGNTLTVSCGIFRYRLGSVQLLNERLLLQDSQPQFFGIEPSREEILVWKTTTTNIGLNGRTDGYVVDVLTAVE